ncbi:hypothetical protein IEQ34_016728 [Dendrobium chrysotoxum]|uniref:Uncharacterized protein n=1 Tax=Dendrobium chrysotoxum TaxID=161865 RepID=A0AAV7GGJ9_DENCH|nr:hypothetical protein IEQ34_016728 [Dendrobium chrysotoxum]
MDKYLKLFQNMRSPLLIGAKEPIKAENWLLRIGKIHDGSKVSPVTFALDGEANKWWRGQHQNKFGDLHSMLIDWGDIVGTLR